ncbi:type II secretion system protein [Amycolatopsis endophytica]|uniref:Tight adherence protein B n=1 Tax=Amycolatopsis endophytica TaxID=860233 RepID=A0A853B1K3_9PSEU|nr:type II secretion system F family protein [Amycolatopsis endophytica]NYI88993.1 tight adherence protein B [Amycolatopsis endophytica]
MLTHTVTCAAAALACWPSARGSTGRLRALAPPVTARIPLPRKALALGLVPLLFLVPPAVSMAGALLGWSGWRHWRARRRAASSLTTRRAMAEALHAMVVDLRAGAPPDLAAESAAADAPRPVAELLEVMAGVVRFGGDLAGAPASVATAEPLGQVRGRLVRAWALSQRHGLPLAELLDAVRRDITAHVRFATQAGAAMSGPRSSAMVLTALPVVGLLLGEGMGARPVHVLFATPGGQLLLLLGTVLIIAGVGWSARITSGGAR